MLIRSVVFVLLSSIVPSQAGSRGATFQDDDGSWNRPEDVAEIQLVKKGTPYAELRRRMLAIGYVARPAGSDSDRCEPELAKYCSTYPETISCKSVGGADCQFVLYTNGVAFVVKTISNGGEVQRVKSVHHLTIRDQKDLEASFEGSGLSRGAKQNSRNNRLN